MSAALAGPDAAADCVRPPEPEPIAESLAVQDSTGVRVTAGDMFAGGLLAQGASSIDRVGRVVAPVFVNGQGPFRFVVDTGANRSVLSRRLARRLGLGETGSGQVHSINGVENAPFVDVDTLSFGALDLANMQLPVLDGGVFGGELGLLGVDGMSGRRLRMNFRDNCIEISNAATARRLRGWSTVRGELRFGHLFIADARVQNVDIRVLIDTGSDITLANRALRRALEGARNRRTDVRSYTAGDLLVLENAVIVPRLRIGELSVSNVSAFVGDYHIFSLWGLDDEPTLLLGMDVLMHTREIAIDYDRAQLHIRIDDRRRGMVNGSRW
jgi:predicted aspartyl protease